MRRTSTFFPLIIFRRNKIIDLLMLIGTLKVMERVDILCKVYVKKFFLTHLENF